MNETVLRAGESFNSGGMEEASTWFRYETAVLAIVRHDQNANSERAL